MISVKEMLEGYVKDEKAFIKSQEDRIKELQENIKRRRIIIKAYEEAIAKLY